MEESAVVVHSYVMEGMKMNVGVHRNCLTVLSRKFVEVVHMKN